MSESCVKFDGYHEGNRLNKLVSSPNHAEYKECKKNNKTFEKIDILRILH